MGARGLTSTHDGGCCWLKRATDFLKERQMQEHSRDGKQSKQVGERKGIWKGHLHAVIELLPLDKQQETNQHLAQASHPRS